MAGMRRIVVDALQLGCIAVLGCVAAGFFGALHPAFDSLAHFRMHGAAALVFGGLFLVVLRCRLPGLTVWFAGLCVAAVPLLSSAASPDAAAQEGPRYRLMHLNLRYDNETPERVLSLIGRTRPDILSLNEVSESWRRRLAHLKAAYPYRIVCPEPSPIGGVAIFSTRPLIEGEGAGCRDRGSFAHAAIDVSGHRLDVVALHLGWPWPFGQHRQVGRITEPLGSLKAAEAVILAGDFNAAGWSYTASRIAEAGGLERLAGTGATWLSTRLPDLLRPLIGLPIDHVMHRGAVRIIAAQPLDAVGSDHLPILVEFTLPSQPLKEPATLQAMTVR